MGNINYNDHFEAGIVSPSYKIFTIAEKFDKNFISSMLETELSVTAGTAERQHPLPDILRRDNRSDTAIDKL